MCVAEPVVGEPQQTGKSYDAEVLSDADRWIANLNHEQFKEDVRQLGKALAEQQGPADVAHLRKIMMWQRAFSLIGALTMWYCVNPVSIFLLSVGTMARWTMIGHHVCHGGYDRCSDGDYNRFKFAVGSLWRRCVDWLDWMLVEAWNVEHNQIHHYSLGEIADPDLVENNLSALRVSSMPMWAKRAKVYGLMMVWKWIYYAPNTFKMLKIHELRRRGQVPTYHDGTRVPERTLTEPWLVHPSWLQGEGPIFFSNLEFFGRVLAPLFVRQFLLLPGFFGLVLGPSAATRALVSLVLAELLTNVHSFIIIVTNHAGADLYRFDKHCEARTATFYLRQVISSANFATGGDLNDFFHGWLNYQIEHHCWPDLSMLSYQKAAPLLRQICAKHGVPYVQQSVWSRLWKTIDIMTGVSSMRRFPNKWEHAPDLAPADRESSSKRL